MRISIFGLGYVGAVSLACLIILSVGGSIPFAILVAQPFAMFFLLSVYEQRVGRPEKKERFEQHISPPPPPITPPKLD